VQRRLQRCPSDVVEEVDVGSSRRREEVDTFDRRQDHFVRYDSSFLVMLYTAKHWRLAYLQLHTLWKVLESCLTEKNKNSHRKVEFSVETRVNGDR